MDRDGLWIVKAYDALVLAEGIRQYPQPKPCSRAMRTANRRIHAPAVILDKISHKLIGSILDGDGAIFCNFRLTAARSPRRFLQPRQGFTCSETPKLALSVSRPMTSVQTPGAFAPMRLTHILARS
jgi:bisphosphoglycerate-independent phosphoglycerate mutase (AlkP superfamily)